jgi:hypothetical protein
MSKTGFEKNALMQVLLVGKIKKSFILCPV